MLESGAKNWLSYKIGPDNYAIEQFVNKDDAELLQFVYYNYETCKSAKKKDGINSSIDYVRKLYRTRYGKDYIGEGDNEDYPDSQASIGGDQVTRRMVTRLVMRKIQKMVSILMDSKPEVFIRPAVGGAVDPLLEAKLAQFGGIQALTELFQRLWQDWWDRNYIDKVNYMAILAGIRESISIINTYWDAERNYGDGDVVMGLNDPTCYIPEPGCTEQMQCSMQFFDRLIDARRGQKEYGDKFVEDNIGRDNVGGDSENLKEDQRKRDGFNQSDIVVVDSIWKDSTKIYFDTTTGGKISKSQYDKLKEQAGAEGVSVDQFGVKEQALYPFGRIISFTETGIYRDIANDNPFDPFELFVPLPEPFDIWGYSMAQVIAPFQEAYDKILQMIMDNFERVGNTWIFMKERALANGQNNMPADLAGQIIKIKDEADMSDIMHVVAGHVIAPDAWPILQMLDQQTDDSTSIHDASEGNKPAGMQSGRAFLALQEATNRLLRIVSKFYEKVLQKIAMKVIWLMYKNYSEGRTYSYITDGNKMLAQLPLDLKEIDLVFDIFVQPGSLMPRGAAQEAEKYMSLFEVGLASPKEVRKAYGVRDDQSNAVQEYEMMKQDAMQKMQNSQGNPAAMQKVMSEIHPDMQMAIQRDMEQARMEGQEQVSSAPAGPGVG